MSRDPQEILKNLSAATHRGGAFNSEVLSSVIATLPSGPLTTLETGCGKSTIVFSNISKRHYVFTYDDRKLDDSSVLMVQNSPDFISESTKFIYGPTQKTLRSSTFEDDEFFDVVMLDGPHGYPFPDFEYALLYDRLKEGSFLIIDDIHIPSIGNMFDTLRVDRMYDEIGIFSTTGVLRRTGISGVPSDGDHWYEQQYNVSQFPLSMKKYQVDRSFRAGAPLHFNNRQVLDRYCGRGLEMSPSGDCIQTTDISATLRFDYCINSDAPSDDLLGVVLNIEYMSVYNDASVGASVTLGGPSQALPYHDKFRIAQFRFNGHRAQRMTVTFLHPSSIPEHDRGNKRYEFRRLGIFIKSISIELLSETPKSSSHSWSIGSWSR